MKNKNCIQWTQAADAPFPIYSATAVVHNYKVYVAGCSGSDEDVHYKVFMYDIAKNQWSTLPDPKQSLAVHEIIGGLLTLVGGQDRNTDEVSKSLSSYDESSQNWMNYFPDMLIARSRCSVVKYGDYVIVAGGDTEEECVSTIEVMSIIEKRWREVATRLPCPMWNMSTTICNNEMFIIGFAGDDNMRHVSSYKLSVNEIINSTTARSWSTLQSPSRARTTVVPYFNQPLIVGGSDTIFNAVADISMCIMGSWILVDTLKTSRAYSIVAAVDDNAIIVIGGCQKAKNRTACLGSAMATVEIGQAVLRDDHVLLQNEEDAQTSDDINVLSSPSDVSHFQFSLLNDSDSSVITFSRSGSPSSDAEYVSTYTADALF